jgi:hypothetical protein
MTELWLEDGAILSGARSFVDRIILEIVQGELVQVRDVRLG